MWWLYINSVLTIFSVCMIAGTIRLHFASKKLHQLNATLTMMELQQQGTLMWWRQRALTAERELKQLRGE